MFDKKLMEKEQKEADLEPETVLVWNASHTQLVKVKNQKLGKISDTEIEEILREEQEAEDMEAEARSNYIREAFEW